MGLRCLPVPTADTANRTKGPADRRGSLIGWPRSASVPRAFSSDRYGASDKIQMDRDNSSKSIGDTIVQ